MSDQPGFSNSTIGLLITAVVALASVVAFLFRMMMKRDTSKDKRLAQGEQNLAEERKAIAVRDQQWETRMEKLRADYEMKNRELAEKYAEDLKSLYDDNRVHEDAARKEFADILENVSAKAGESSQAIVNMLDKFYERFVGPRARY